MRARIGRLLLLAVGLTLALPAIPSTAFAGTDQASPPHFRRRRVRRYVPPPPPPHVRRREVHHHHHTAPAQSRPRQTIADPQTSFYVGIGGVGSFVIQNDDFVSEILDSGGGLEMFFGVRFSRYLAFELGGMFTFHDTNDTNPNLVRVGRTIDKSVLSGITGDLKVFFAPSSRRIEPFFQVGVGGFFLARDSFENELAGIGFNLGAGVDIRVNRMFAIGTRFLYRGMFLDNADAIYWTGGLYENTYLNVFTLSANLQLHF